MKTFVLGVGAQKAGTTWLWKLLCNSEFAQEGIKEFHFLNTLEKKLGDSKIISQKSIRGINLTNPFNFDSCIRDYISFFNDILNNSSKYHTGEITPAYAMLSP